MAKCPLKFRLQQFEGGEECDPECAWLVAAYPNPAKLKNPIKTCAINLVGKDTDRSPLNPMEEE